jgi:hypothetical protein
MVAPDRRLLIVQCNIAAPPLSQQGLAACTGEPVLIEIKVESTRKIPGNPHPAFTIV